MMLTRRIAQSSIVRVSVSLAPRSRKADRPQCESRVSDSRIPLLPGAGEEPGMRETVMTYIIRGISTVMTVRR